LSGEIIFCKINFALHDTFYCQTCTEKQKINEYSFQNCETGQMSTEDEGQFVTSLKVMFYLYV